MTHYKIVREACVEESPEIIQPCRCTQGRITTQVFTSFKCGLCRKRLSWHNSLTPKWCNDCSSRRGVCGHCKEPTIKNARDIRLADVLLAIHTTKAYNYFVDIRGYFWKWHNTDIVPVHNEYVKWNLRHDSLEWHRDNQPETVEWLAELLASN